MTDKPEPRKPAKQFSDDKFAEIADLAIKEAAQECERMIKVMEKAASQQPPMDTAENLHPQLTRAFAALHKIALPNTPGRGRG